jgi:hypothetical protein
MKKWVNATRLLCIFLWLFVISLVTGCKTWSYTFKHRGIYTILCNSTNILNEDLDLDSPSFAPKNSFGPGEQPTVVMVGFIGPSTLALRDLKNNQKLGSESISLNWSTVTIQPLDIRRSGQYEIYFTDRDYTNTSFKFSVTRNQNPFVESQQTTNSAKEWPFGNVFRLELSQAKSTFKNYDAVFIYSVEQKWYELIDSTNLPPKRGVVVLKFHLNSDGSISSIKIGKSSLNEAFISLCQKALLNISPCKPWPDEMRKKVGKDYREIAFTFYYY